MFEFILNFENSFQLLAWCKQEKINTFIKFIFYFILVKLVNITITETICLCIDNHHWSQQYLHH